MTTARRLRATFAVEPWLLRLLLVFGVSMVAVNAIRPMTTYRALALGATPVEIGLIASAFSILSVVAALPIGRWVDRVGEGAIYVLGTALIGSAAVAAVFVGSLPALAACQAVLGLGHVMNLVAGQTMIANRGGRSGRDARYGTYATVASLGQLIGPAAAAVLASLPGTQATPGLFGTNNAQAPIFLFAALCALAAAAIALGLPRGRERRPADDLELVQQGNILSAAGRVIRRPGMSSAILVSVVVISGVDVLIAYLPALGADNGLSVGFIGALLAIRAGASMASRLFMGRLIGMLGRRRLLVAGMATAALAVSLVPFATAAGPLVVLMILVGLGLGIGQPMTIAWVAGQSLRTERATALSIRLMGNRAALLVVPTMMGAVAGSAGMAAIFVVLASMLTAGAAIAARAPFTKPGDVAVTPVL